MKKLLIIFLLLGCTNNIEPPYQHDYYELLYYDSSLVNIAKIAWSQNVLPISYNCSNETINLYITDPKGLEDDCNKCAYKFYDLEDKCSLIGCYYNRNIIVLDDKYLVTLARSQHTKPIILHELMHWLQDCSGLPLNHENPLIWGNEGALQLAFRLYFLQNDR